MVGGRSTVNGADIKPARRTATARSATRAAPAAHPRTHKAAPRPRRRPRCHPRSRTCSLNDGRGFWGLPKERRIQYTWRSLSSQSSGLVMRACTRLQRRSRPSAVAPMAALARSSAFAHAARTAVAAPSNGSKHRNSRGGAALDGKGQHISFQHGFNCCLKGAAAAQAAGAHSRRRRRRRTSQWSKAAVVVPPRPRSALGNAGEAIGLKFSGLSAQLGEEAPVCLALPGLPRPALGFQPPEQVLQIWVLADKGEAGGGGVRAQGVGRLARGGAKEQEGGPDVRSTQLPVDGERGSH